MTASPDRYKTISINAARVYPVYDRLPPIAQEALELELEALLNHVGFSYKGRWHDIDVASVKKASTGDLSLNHRIILLKQGLKAWNIDGRTIGQTMRGVIPMTLGMVMTGTETVEDYLLLKRRTKSMVSVAGAK